MISRLHVVTFLGVLVLAALAQAQTFTVFYNFPGGADGGGPSAVIQSPVGDLYGTASEGGDLNCNAPDGCGVVYKLNPSGKETVLHSFTGGPDGQWPVTPLARDSQGNLYGTTVGYWGTVFKIDAAGNETLLHTFACASDGGLPYQGLVRDKAGNLYGTTFQCGGASGFGTIFKIDSAGNFTLLHTFTGYPSDGAWPENGHLTLDKFGNLYGVTTHGGSIACYDGFGCGVLYKLSKEGTFTVLHNFAGGSSDGCWPYGSVARDTYGNFYGTTNDWACNKLGTLWRVSMKGKETVLHNFAGGTSDGCNTYEGVTLDSKGNLYGVTQNCGAYNYGVLYELSAKGEFTLLHSFDGSDGAYPDGELLRTCKGKLFGTTAGGGTGGGGTVWSYLPGATAVSDRRLAHPR